MGAAVGIDLGTTNSVVAHVGVSGRPAVVLNRLDAVTTPSVLCFTDDGVLVGESAKEMQGIGHPGAVAFFKRHMGDPSFEVYLGGQDRSAVELSAILLGELKSGAEERLGTSVDRAVITVPAYFRNPQREATIAAGRQAGLKVLQVINEPTAAAVSYGLGRGGNLRNVLVYDLGGGTFDVTVMRISADQVRVLTSVGDHELGGKDWDERIVDFIGQQFHDEYGLDPFDDVDSLGEMWVAAEGGKVALSNRHQVRLRVVHGGERGRYDLSRSRFESLTHDLMQRTSALTLSALKDIGLKPTELDGVLLVGGSTRMPMVHDFVRNALGLTPIAGVNVDEAVALGAAIVAAEHCVPKRFALGGRRRTVDVTNHSLGMIAVNEAGTAYTNSIVLPKNQTIPCVETRPFRHRGGGDLEVFMTQGESERPDTVTYLGRYVVRDVPWAKDNALTVIDIRYAYDVSGTVEVHAAARGGHALQVDIETLPDDVPERFMQAPRAAIGHATIYLAFDLSGSMSGAPLREAQRAAQGFVDNIDLSTSSMGIIGFADSTAVAVEACQNAGRIRQAIDQLSSLSVGWGNSTDPFDEVFRLLGEKLGPRYVVTLADGVWSNQSRAVERAQRCMDSGMELIAIGFGGADESFLRRIATSDAGSLFTDLDSLVDTFSTIAQVLTETPPAPGGYLAPFQR